jgi:tetratricopeptide (TPR) repeat protein
VFLVTSRERLRLPGEQIFAVEPLPEAPAMALFEARARGQDRDFALSEGNRADVAAIVRTLDGIPLAIELAAARIRVLAPKQLRERLRERFRILAGARGLDERQATLLAAIDWSWDLLAPWERSALAQCSAFVGGFTLRAAEAVLDLSAFAEAPLALDAVQTLVDKSLLRAEADRRDIEEPYFGMYVSIHEYATQKLRAPGAFDGSGPKAEQSAWIRHGSFYARFGTEDALDALDGHGGVEMRRRLALDLENLVTACRRAVARGDGESAAATLSAAWAVLALRGPFASANALGREALTCKGLSAVAQARVLSCSGDACWLAGRMEEAREHYERALAIHREAGDRRLEGHVLGNLGKVHEVQGRMEEAREHYERALAVSREVDNRCDEGIVLGSLGLLHQTQGRMEEARECYERALVLDREVGNRRFEGQVLGNLGLLHRAQGRTLDAREHYERALAVSREVGNRRSEGHVLGFLGELHQSQGRMEEAREHLERSLAIDREVGDRIFEGVVLANLGALHIDQGRTSEAQEHYERALAIHREVGNRRSEGIVLGNLGRLHKAQGRTLEAREHYEQALAIHREVGNRRSEGIMLGNLGELDMEQGRMDEAREHYERALAIHCELGDRSHEGIELGRLGSVCARAGARAEARASFAAGERCLREVGDKFELGGLLCARGEMEAEAGDLMAARTALDEACKLAADVAAGPESALAGAVAKLRERLVGKADGFQVG